MALQRCLRLHLTGTATSQQRVKNAAPGSGSGLRRPRVTPPPGPAASAHAARILPCMQPHPSLAAVAASGRNAL
eukprot:364287-Chlamydomonas_euryale.AAC.9